MKGKEGKQKKTMLIRKPKEKIEKANFKEKFKTNMRTTITSQSYMRSN